MTELEKTKEKRLSETTIPSTAPLSEDLRLIPAAFRRDWAEEVRKRKKMTRALRRGDDMCVMGVAARVAGVPDRKNRGSAPRMGWFKDVFKEMFSQIMESGKADSRFDPVLLDKNNIDFAIERATFHREPASVDLLKANKNAIKGGHHERAISLNDGSPMSFKLMADLIYPEGIDEQDTDER